MCRERAEHGLNPFEFRAGIYFPVDTAYESYTAVLIPLNSGLVFTSAWIDTSDCPTRLNPFEFRAGIYFCC